MWQRFAQEQHNKAVAVIQLGATQPNGFVSSPCGMALQLSAGQPQPSPGPTGLLAPCRACAHVQNHPSPDPIALFVFSHEALV